MNKRIAPYETLSKLSNLNFFLKRSLFGLYTGFHKSNDYGSSVEFTEHKQYYKGDDIKTIDWHLYGRADRFFIKKYEKETNMDSYIFIDASRSMDYGSHHISKLDFACQLASVMLYIVLNQRDRAGLIASTGNKDYDFMPSSQYSQYNVITDSLKQIKAKGKLDVDNWLKRAAKIKKSFCIVMSDLFFDEKKNKYSDKSSYI